MALYCNLDREDQELASEITSRTKYQILRDTNGQIERVLTPISGDLQIHIYKSKDEYKLAFTPVDYTKEERVLRIEVKTSAYQDIYEESQNSTLVRTIVKAFESSVNSRSMQKGDRVTLYCSQKKREGKLQGDITIYIAVVEINKNAQEVFLFNDTYYGCDGEELESFLLAKPVVCKGISSYFVIARFHPVLKRYRARLGTNYTAPTGASVESSGNDTVTFISTQEGYGKVIKIKHVSGYTTLYAHLSRFTKIKTGQRVK